MSAKAIQRTQLTRSVSTGRLILCLNLSSFVLSYLDIENITTPVTNNSPTIKIFVRV